LRTNRETTPEGFHDEVLSDHITRHREVSQQVNDPQSLPAHEVARVRRCPRCFARIVIKEREPYITSILRVVDEHVCYAEAKVMYAAKSAA
jgi:hypothetical protein